METALRETAMKNHNLAANLPILAIVFLAGCATGPELTQEQILGQYEQVAELEKGLNDARAQGVDNLSPTHYQAASERLNEALSEAKADRPDTTRAAAAKGLQSLAKANQQADVSRDLLRDVLVGWGETNKLLSFIRDCQAGRGNMHIASGDFIEDILQIIFYDEINCNPEVFGEGLNQIVFRSGGTMWPGVIRGGCIASQDAKFTAVLDLFQEVFLGRTGVQHQRQRGRAKHKN